jgi:hypothetical protein
MRISKPLFALAAALALAGCHSPYIAATIVNSTGQPLSLIELDYPSASFGTGSLAPGASYHYRFKVLGSGPATLLWTDAARHDHKAAGPALQEGDEGSLVITLAPGEPPAWSLHLVNRASGGS